MIAKAAEAGTAFGILEVSISTYDKSQTSLSSANADPPLHLQVTSVLIIGSRASDRVEDQNAPRPKSLVRKIYQREEELKVVKK